MIEEGLHLYIILVIILIAIFVISLFIPFYGFMSKRFKGLLLGCIIQPIVFGIIAVILTCGIYYYLTHEIARHREDSMVTLIHKSDTTQEAYISKWHIKPDGECFYEFGKHKKDKPGILEIDDNDDIALFDVIPLDSFRVCVDDVITVKFDLKNRKVSALNYDKPMEVENVDWNKVETYFNNLPSE